jgi:hypothetical protein
VLLDAICLLLVLIIGYFMCKWLYWLFYSIKSRVFQPQEDSGVIEQKLVEPRIEAKYIDFKEYCLEAKAQVNKVAVDTLPETVMHIVKTMFLTTELPYPVDKIKRYVNLIIRQAIVRVHPDRCRVQGIDSEKGSAIASFLSDLKSKANDLLIDDIQDYMIRSAAQEEKKKQGLIDSSWTYGCATLEESPLAMAEARIISHRFFEGDTEWARSIARDIADTKQFKDQSREAAIKHQEQLREAAIKHQEKLREAAIKHQEQLRQLDMKHQAERQERNNERDALYERFGIKQNNIQVKPIACKLQYEAYLEYLGSIKNINVDMLNGVLVKSKKYVDNDCDQVGNIINEKVKQLIICVQSAQSYNTQPSMRFMVDSYIESIKSLVNELKQDIKKEIIKVECVEEAKMQEEVSVSNEFGNVAAMTEVVLAVLPEDKENSSNYGSFDALLR